MLPVAVAVAAYSEVVAVAVAAYSEVVQLVMEWVRVEVAEVLLMVAFASLQICLIRQKE